MAAAKDVSRWVYGEGYLPGAVTSVMSKADYWLVAHALAHGCAVVTHEVRAQTVKKVKIPNACDGLGVRFRGSLDDAEDNRGTVRSGSGGIPARSEP